MKKQIPVSKFHRLINHGPIILVTSGNKTEYNVAPIAWSMPVNDEPPLAGIAVAETHYTAELIKKNESFVINVPDASLVGAIKICGKVSGKGTNKFKTAKLTPQKGTKIATPHIEECIAYIECKLADQINYDGVVLFIGKVVYCAANNGLFNEVWTEKAQTIHHMGSNVFALTGKRIKS